MEPVADLTPEELEVQRIAIKKFHAKRILQVKKRRKDKLNKKEVVNNETDQLY